ncbi:hypothetical protein PGB90_006256 [Kerria lacca]
MSLQIIIAVIFFTLYEETDDNSSESYFNNILSEKEFKLYEAAEAMNENEIMFKINNKNVKHLNTIIRIADKIKTSFKLSDVIMTTKPIRNEIFIQSTMCNITRREPISAINRAKTSYCKQLIVNTTCLLQNNQLYPVHLPHSCPAHGLTRESDECFCGNDEPLNISIIPNSFCNLNCPSNSNEMCGGYFTMNVLETGVAKFSAQTANDASSCGNDISNQPLRIVFLLTLNGRSVRQVHRLIKMLFHRDHFFLIHVDDRQDYMFRELLSLELKLSNFRLSRRRHSTIWGGASLLTMLLQSMSELIQSSWDWDFLINLSESDFPIKNNEQLVTFLSANRNRNFVKSHGRDTQHFIHKQGLDKTFVECDEHMWRIGNKSFPTGIVIDGGSDWLALSRTFINYVVTAQNDQLLEGLKTVFKYSLLPAESTMNKSLFFARKFDPTVSQAVINNIQERLYGRYVDEFKSEKKYWHNIYHYKDRNPIPDEAMISVCSSLSRCMLKLQTNNDFLCPDLRFNKLLQVFSFYEDDIHKDLVVNTNFDAKEKMSRNYVSAIGPLSEPVLIYHVISGLAVSNIVVLWLDPMQTMTDISEISIDEMSGVHYLKSNLKTPLLPGEWEVFLIHNSNIVAQVLFVVTPSVQESTINVIQNIVPPVEASTDLNYLLPVIKLKKDTYNPEKSKVEFIEKFLYTGFERIRWIDDLNTKRSAIIVDRKYDMRRLNTENDRSQVTDVKGIKLRISKFKRKNEITCDMLIGLRP